MVVARCFIVFEYAGHALTATNGKWSMWALTWSLAQPSSASAETTKVREMSKQSSRLVVAI